MNSLDANIRDNSTKGQLNALRNSGNVPAIIYGGKDQNQKVSISKKLLKFLIEKENTLDLLEKMKWFIDNQDSIKKMGYESFKLALEKFNVKLINKKIINFMDL